MADASAGQPASPLRRVARVSSAQPPALSGQYHFQTALRDGELICVDRSDSVLQWFSKYIRDSYPSIVRPPAPREQVDGVSGLRRSGRERMHSDVLCKYAATWMLWWLRHRTVSTSCLELWSVVSGQPHEIAHLVSQSRKRTPYGSGAAPEAAPSHRSHRECEVALRMCVRTFADAVSDPVAAHLSKLLHGSVERLVEYAAARAATLQAMRGVSAVWGCLYSDWWLGSARTPFPLVRDTSAAGSSGGMLSRFRSPRARSRQPSAGVQLHDDVLSVLFDTADELPETAAEERPQSASAALEALRAACEHVSRQSDSPTGEDESHTGALLPLTALSSQTWEAAADVCAVSGACSHESAAASLLLAQGLLGACADLGETSCRYARKQVEQLTRNPSEDLEADVPKLESGLLALSGTEREVRIEQRNARRVAVRAAADAARRLVKGELAAAVSAEECWMRMSECLDSVSDIDYLTIPDDALPVPPSNPWCLHPDVRRERVHAALAAAECDVRTLGGYAKYGLEPCHRAAVWRLLLLPGHEHSRRPAEWAHSKRERRDAYSVMRSAVFDRARTFRAAAPASVHPNPDDAEPAVRTLAEGEKVAALPASERDGWVRLAQPEGGWVREDCGGWVASEAQTRIDADVPRTMPTGSFWSRCSVEMVPEPCAMEPTFTETPGSPRMKRYHRCLRRLLLVYAGLNTGIGYVQGMNEIAAHLLVALSEGASSEELDASCLESDAFFCFTALLSRLGNNFCRALDGDASGLLRWAPF
eukprot:TRINITY_DN6214_c0_g2_i3.p1 TRINITY_DN6214_c0_g2~~TRINITY_DN6214_c0_g2_i3.p1  ORF type:complete len:786 (+),score=131.61 TRINITY_DN6214_c0_g2_i3:69-2360(+)